MGLAQVVKKGRKSLTIDDDNGLGPSTRIVAANCPCRCSGHISTDAPEGAGTQLTNPRARHDATAAPERAIGAACASDSASASSKNASQRLGILPELVKGRCSKTR